MTAANYLSGAGSAQFTPVNDMGFSDDFISGALRTLVRGDGEVHGEIDWGMKNAALYPGKPGQQGVIDYPKARGPRTPKLPETNDKP